MQKKCFFIQNIKVDHKEHKYKKTSSDVEHICSYFILKTVPEE